MRIKLLLILAGLILLCIRISAKTDAEIRENNAQAENYSSRLFTSFPSAPTDLKAVWNELENTIILTWTNPILSTDGNAIVPDSNIIYCDGNETAKVSGNVNSYRIKDLSAGYHIFGIQTFADGNGSAIAYSGQIAVSISCQTYARNDVQKNVGLTYLMLDSISVPSLGSIQRITVTIDTLFHTNAGDLDISLISPDGIVVNLQSGSGYGGNYFQCTFDDSAKNSIRSTSPPMAGSWIPLNSLSPLLPNGTEGIWQIRIYDHANGSGTLQAWSLHFYNTMKPFSSITWNSGLTIVNKDGQQSHLIFGQSPFATDRLDTTLGEFELPPLPPSGGFDVRFHLPGAGNVYTPVDYRNDSLSKAEWDFSIQSGADKYPLTLSWDPVSLPPGKWTIEDGVTGSIINADMLLQQSVVITQAGLTTMRILYDRSGCQNFMVNSGWNLISVPLLCEDMTASSIFPAAVSLPFNYSPSEGQYAISKTLQKKAGYWLQFSRQQTIAVCGSLLKFDTLQVYKGWNIIAPGGQAVATGNLQSQPSGILVSNFFGFESGYTSASTLNPGKGYWIKASSNGVVFLKNGLSKRTGADYAVHSDVKSATLSFTDGAGNTRKLLLMNNGIDPAQYELPPLPPAGIFDVRFSSGSAADNIGSGGSLVKIQSATGPLTITARGIVVRIKGYVQASGTAITIADGKSYTLNGTIPAALEIETISAPEKYALYANYPNPFNPVTVIKYSLPKKSFVSLKIYDALGREVAAPVDGEQDAGSYTAEFNGNTFSSGIYVCMLRAGDYSSAIKMMLLK
jgi:subtilisin-like proprotein convertase family protein